MKKDILKGIKTIVIAICIGTTIPSITVNAADEPTIQETLGETNAGSEDPNYYYEPTSVNYVSDYVAYMQLPAYVRLLINEKNTKINIVAGQYDIETLYNLGNEALVDGVYDSRTNQIIVESPSDMDKLDLFMLSRTYRNYANNASKAQILKDRSITSLYHEIGHLVDFSITGYNYSQELTMIYDGEINKFKTTHYFRYRLFSGPNAISDITEYYANAFACYYLEPEELRTKCPYTYNYIMAVENMYNNKYGLE